MSVVSPHRVVQVLLERHGRTFAEELGIDLATNSPEVLFRWMCAALLLSARIRAGNAMRAARALTDRGWMTARDMAAATWEERTHVLNQAGYARYDESTARMLGSTAELLLAEYGGDLRRLRHVAGHDPGQERELLKACKGVGEVGVDIYFRELQVAWQELYPFADRKALRTAALLGLPSDAEGLAQLVPHHELARLVAALVRVSLAREVASVLEAVAPDVV